MRLPNTKVYYKDLAHYYFEKQRMELAGFFLTLSNGEHVFAKTDTNDWFASPFGAERPAKNEDGTYV